MNNIFKLLTVLLELLNFNAGESPEVTDSKRTFFDLFYSWCESQTIERVGVL